jgi:hypothetical protein
MEGVWGILAAPPAQTSMITSPGTYAPQPRWGDEYFHVLSGIEKLFGAGWKPGDIELVNGFDAHRMYAYLDGAQRDRLVASIELMYTTTLSRWPDYGNARLYVTVLRDVEAFYETLGSTRNGVPQPQALPGLDADVNRFFPNVHEDAESDGHIHTALHVRRGRLVVDLRTVDSGLGSEDYARIVESLFEGIQGVPDH